MSQINKTLINRGKQSLEFEGHPPAMRFSYQFAHPFNKIALAYLRQHNWERRTQLSTIADVEQVDDDTLVYYRR